MKRILFILLIITAFGCSKDDVNNTITQKGLLPAPDWLVGTWESEDKTNKLIVKENGEIFIDKSVVLSKDDNFDKTYHKDNSIFSFFYNRSDAINIGNENDWIVIKKSVIFRKWEFKKISDTKISVDYYFCDKNGNRLKAGKYEEVTITIESSTPTIYTKVK